MPDNKKILAVDDEKAVLNLLSRFFSKEGYRVLTAESARQALDIIRDNAVYVMLFDLNMPEMDGIELCRVVKKRMPMSVIFAITGYASLFELAECREAGFEDYFKKPVNLTTLLEKTEAAFEKLGRWKVS